MRWCVDMFQSTDLLGTLIRSFSSTIFWGCWNRNTFQLMIKWCFGARWFMILRVPSSNSNNPFHFRGSQESKPLGPKPVAEPWQNPSEKEKQHIHGFGRCEIPNERQIKLDVFTTNGWMDGWMDVPTMMFALQKLFLVTKYGSPSGYIIEEICIYIYIISFTVHILVTCQWKNTWIFSCNKLTQLWIPCINLCILWWIAVRFT